MKLSGKTIALSGASGGIGVAMAHALANCGARLILCGRSIGALTSLASELEGSNHIVVQADLKGVSGRRKLLDVSQRESVDILINNAGINQLAFLPGMTDAQIEELIAINMTTPILLCRDFLPLLQTRTEAAIVNIGSILGSIGYAGSTCYCASKFGLRGFTEALRREVADSAVKVFYLAPRATNTALNSEAIRAMNKALNIAVDKPEVVAESLVALLQKANVKNRYLGWPEAIFVRLNSLLPSVVDKALKKQLATIRHHAGG